MVPLMKSVIRLRTAGSVVSKLTTTGWSFRKKSATFWESSKLEGSITTTRTSVVVFTWIVRFSFLFLRTRDKRPGFFSFTSFSSNYSSTSFGAYGTYGFSSSYVAFSYDGVSYYSSGSLQPSSYFYNGTCYSSCNVLTGSYIGDTYSIFQPANLDISDYIGPPLDSRVLNVSKVTYTSSDMIGFQTDDVPDSSCFITFDYTDSLGSWHTYLDYNHFDVYPGDDYNLILINPLDVSLTQFTLTGGTYYGSDEWGYKDYSCDLDFNENPIEFNNNFYDAYYYNNTYQTIYNSIDGFGYGYIRGKTTSTDRYFWDDSLALVQPFKFSVIALPLISHVGNNPVTNDSYYWTFLDLYKDSYDVLLVDVPETTFNYIYGSGMYTDFNNSLFGSNLDLELIDWYSAHSPIIGTLPYSLIDLNTSYDINQYCGIYYTDSFFYKQLSYLIGDNSDILSEFSERFFKADGFSDRLLSNLYDLYLQDNIYYSDAIGYISKINYYLNDAFEKQYLPSIISSLSSSNSYLLSIDSKLNDVDDILAALSDLTYLGDIDTKLEDLDDILTNTGSVLTGLGLLLSDTNDMVTLLNSIELDSSASSSILSDIYDFLENEFTFDVQVNLPEFDTTVIVQIYGQGIGDFIDFFNEWIMVLPDFDFSEFPDFFDNVSDTIDEFADSNDDLIGNLDTPYEYDDSKLHFLGWD